MKILKETSDWLLGGGILSCLTANFNVPWKNKINGQTLDDDYYGNRSGCKLISPFTEMLLDTQTHKLDATATKRLADIIYGKYGENWDKAYEAITMDYNPIHNYDGSETYSESYDDTVRRDLDGTDGYTKTNTGTSGVSGSNTGTQQTSGTDTGTQATVEDTTDNVTHGFTNYLETTTHGKTETQDKTFPTSRKSEKTIEGTATKTHSVDANNPYTTDVKTANKEYHEEKVYGFNSSNAVPSSESKTLNGSSNGTDPSIGGGGGNGSYNETTTTENGAYSDEQSYNGYKETVTESGSERVVTANSGTDTLGIGGSKSDNEDRDSTVTRTDNLAHAETRTDNLAHSETRTDNLSESNSGTRSEDETTIKSGHLTHTLERGGNYGMTTTQQMITEEMELRKVYNLFDCIVFPDIDKVMVLNNFEPNGILY